MKIFKKLAIQSLFVLVALISLSFTGSVTAEINFDNYIRNEQNITTTSLNGGVTLHKETAQTYSTDASWHNQTIQWVDTQKAFTDVSLVSWTYASKHDWSAQTVGRMAKSWEDNHPGEIVIAAVNGDFFNISSTGEPLSCHIQDGDVLQASNGNPKDKGGNDYQGVLGFKEDNSYIEGVVPYGDYVFDIRHGNDTYDTRLTEVTTNSLPGETGVGVYTTYFNSFGRTDDLTGYKVYLCKYDLCRVSAWSGHNIFVKGSVSEVVDLTSLKPNDVKLNDFYVVTKDSTVIKEMENSTYVRCQKDVTGEWSDVTNACGYIYKILDDSNIVYDKIIPTTNGENTHPRTSIGYKADGSVVLMVSDGRGGDSTYRHGCSYKESAALLAKAGCVDAFNLDGGGSSELIVRDEYGDFKTINTPSDKSSRSDGNCLLLVMKDPGFACASKDSTRTSLTVTRNETLYSKNVSNIQLTINGVTQKMTGTSFVFEGLQDDTEYDIYVDYDMAYGDKTKHNQYILHAKTKDFSSPEVDFSSQKVTTTGFSVVNDHPDICTLKKVSVTIGDTVKEFNVDKNNPTCIDITGLTKGTDYKYTVTYLVYDELTKKDYEFTSDLYKVTTPSFEVPSILKLNLVVAKKFTFEYAYLDNDSRVIEAYILIGESKYNISSKEGTIEIADAIKNTTYPVQLVLKYTNEKGNIITIQSVSQEYTYTPASGCKKSVSNEIFSMLSLLVLAYGIIKKRSN